MGIAIILQSKTKSVRIITFIFLSSNLFIPHSQKNIKTNGEISHLSLLGGFVENIPPQGKIYYLLSQEIRNESLMLTVEINFIVFLGKISPYFATLLYFLRNMQNFIICCMNVCLHAYLGYEKFYAVRRYFLLQTDIFIRLFEITCNFF